jgi:hypothetical protein
VDRILIQKSSKENKKIWHDAAADTTADGWIGNQQASCGIPWMNCLASEDIDGG